MFRQQKFPSDNCISRPIWGLFKSSLTTPWQQKFWELPLESETQQFPAVPQLKRAELL